MASCYQYYPIGNNKSQDEVADEVGKEIHIEVFLKKIGRLWFEEILALRVLTLSQY